MSPFEINANHPGYLVYLPNRHKFYAEYTRENLWQHCKNEVATHNDIVGDYESDGCIEEYRDFYQEPPHELVITDSYDHVDHPRLV